MAYFESDKYMRVMEEIEMWQCDNETQPTKTVA